MPELKDGWVEISYPAGNKQAKVVKQGSKAHLDAAGTRSGDGRPQIKKLASKGSTLSDAEQKKLGGAQNEISFSFARALRCLGRG